MDDRPEPRPDEPVSRPPLVDWRPPTEEPAPVPPGGGRVEVGSTIGRALDTFATEWSLFLLIALPAGALSALSVVPGLEVPATLGLIAVTLLTGIAIVLATDDLWRGRSPALSSLVARSVRPAIVMLLAGVVIGLAAGGLVIIVGAVALGQPALGVVLVLGALVLLALFGVRWSLVQQTIALERAGPLRGLNRSWTLTRGNFWRLFGLVFLLALIVGPATLGSTSVSTYSESRLLAALALLVGTTIATPLPIIALTIAYADVSGLAKPAVAVPPISAPSAEPAAEPAAEAAAEPALDLPPARVPRARPAPAGGRGRALLGIVGLGFVLFAVGFAVTGSSGGIAFVPDRGTLLFGASRGFGDPCRPGDPRTRFVSSDEIWIGGYFRRPLAVGEVATVEYYFDGELFSDGEIEGGPIFGSECYFEEEPTTDLEPGTHRLVIRVESETLAEGQFVVTP